MAVQESNNFSILSNDRRTLLIFHNLKSDHFRPYYKRWLYLTPIGFVRPTGNIPTVLTFLKSLKIFTS